MTTSTRVGARLLGVRARSIASAVLFEPAPAITGTRPFASSTHDLDDALVLVMAQGRALAGRADRDEAVRAFSICQFDMRPEGLLVDRAVANGVTSAVSEPAEPSLVGHGAPRRRASAAFAAPLHCRHISWLAAARKRPALAER